MDAGSFRGCGGGVAAFVDGIMIIVVVIIRVFPRWVGKGAAAEAELDEGL